MNEELQKQLAALLAGLLHVAGDAAKFAGDQIPPLVQEKIIFGRVDETLQLVLVVAVCIVSIVLCTRCVRRLIAGKFDDEFGWVFGTVGTGAVALFTLFASAMQLEMVLMVWFAPRLYIVEWLKGMVTK